LEHYNNPARDTEDEKVMNSFIENPGNFSKQWMPVGDGKLSF